MLEIVYLGQYKVNEKETCLKLRKIRVNFYSGRKLDCCSWRNPNANYHNWGNYNFKSELLFLQVRSVVTYPCLQHAISG